MSLLFDTIVWNFCKEMGFVAAGTGAIPAYGQPGAINLWVETNGCVVAQVSPRFPHIYVYGLIYDDGGIRLDLKGKFDAYDPGSFQDLRQCLLERVRISGYELPKRDERKVGSRQGFFDR